MSHPYLSFISLSPSNLDSIRLSELSPGVNVIFGSNEAGKSRTKDFIEWLMYANATEYENATKNAKKKAFDNMGPQTSGRYRVHIDNRDIAVNISLDNGEVLVTTDSETVSPRDISHILNDEVTRDHYRNVFSLSLDELSAIQSNKLMTESNVAEELLSAAQTVSGVSYTRLVSYLKKEKDELYSQAGNASKRTINKLTRDIRQLDKEIAELKKKEASSSEIQDEIDSKTKEIEEISKELKEANDSLTKLKDTQNYLNVYNEYKALTSKPTPSIHPVLPSKRGEIEVVESQCSDLITVENQLVEVEREVNQLETRVNEQKELLNITLDPNLLDDYVRSPEFKSAVKTHETKTASLNSEIAKLQEDHHKYSKEISLTIKLAESMRSKDIEEVTKDEMQSFFATSQTDVREQQSKKMAVLLSCIFFGILTTVFGALNSILPVVILGTLAIGIPGALLFSSRKSIKLPTPEIPVETDNNIENETVLSQYQLTIEHYQDLIEETLDKKQNCEKQLEEERLIFDQALSKAGFTDSMTHDLLDSYLAQYNIYISDLEKLHIKQPQYNEMQKRINNALERANSLRPYGNETALEMTSPFSSIRQALTWLESIHELALEHESLEKDLYDTQANIQNLEKQLSQTFSSVEKATEIYSHVSEEQLAHDIEVSAINISEKESQKTELSQQIGYLTKQLEVLSNSNELSDALTNRSALQQDLLESHTKFKTLTIATSLADEAAQYFLKENQPAILNKASDFFRRSTNNKWHHVEISYDENQKSMRAEMNVANADRTVTLSASKLSRGAQEQLFLCLRMAVMNTSMKGQHIPVLFDDIAVNADRMRFEALAPLIGEIGLNRQVFYFTCHETTRDILKTRANAKIFEI